MLKKKETNSQSCNSFEDAICGEAPCVGQRSFSRLAAAAPVLLCPSPLPLVIDEQFRLLMVMSPHALMGTGMYMMTPPPTPCPTTSVFNTSVKTSCDRAAGRTYVMHGRLRCSPKRMHAISHLLELGRDIQNDGRMEDISWSKLASEEGEI